MLGRSHAPDEGAEKPVFSPCGVGLRKDLTIRECGDALCGALLQNGLNQGLEHRMPVRSTRSRRQYFTPEAATALSSPKGLPHSHQLPSLAFAMLVLALHRGIHDKVSPLGLYCIYYYATIAADSLIAFITRRER